jgi:MFS family permease
VGGLGTAAAPRGAEMWFNRYGAKPRCTLRGGRLQYAKPDNEEASALTERGRRWPSPWLLLGLATLSQTGMSVAQQGVAVLAVFVRHLLHLSLAEMGLLVSAMSLGVVVGQLIAGLLVDERGPRWLLTWATGLACLVAVGLSRVTQLDGWLAGLFVMGVVLAGVPSAGTRTMFQAFPAPRRGLVMGIRQTGVPIGSALAAATLPILVAVVGLNRVWWVLAGLLLVTGGAFVLAMPPWPRRPSSPGTARRTSLKPALGPMAVAFMLVAGQYSALTFAIPDLEIRQGWTVAAAGLALALVQVGGGMGRIGMGWISDRLRRRAPVIVVLALLAAVMAVGMAVLPRGASAGIVVPLLWLLGVGGVGWNGLTLTWAGERVGEARAGRAMSWTGSAAFLGSAVYPPLFGAVVDATGHFQPAWLLLAGWLFMGAAVVWWVDRDRSVGRLPSRAEAVGR